MDFGVARLADGAATIAHHTQTGVVLGTPGYMAPEQAQGAEVTELTDVYSFGVVLYEMLTGDIPFRGTTPAATLVKLLREQPEPVRTLRPDVPPAVERLVMQVLEKDPAGRPASMAELAKKLRAVADTMGPSARDRAKTRSRRGLGMVAAGAGLLVAAGITWLFARGEFQNPPVTRPADEAPEPVVDVPVTAPVDTAAADRAQYDDHLRVGEFFFDRGNYLDAAAEFEAALAIDPDGARAKELLARTQRAKSAEERILRGG